MSKTKNITIVEIKRVYHNKLDLNAYFKEKYIHAYNSVDAQK